MHAVHSTAAPPRRNAHWCRAAAAALLRVRRPVPPLVRPVVSLWPWRDAGVAAPAAPLPVRAAPRRPAGRRGEGARDAGWLAGAAAEQQRSRNWAPAFRRD